MHPRWNNNFWEKLFSYLFSKIFFFGLLFILRGSSPLILRRQNLGRVLLWQSGALTRWGLRDKWIFKSRAKFFHDLSTCCFMWEKIPSSEVHLRGLPEGLPTGSYWGRLFAWESTPLSFNYNFFMISIFKKKSFLLLLYGSKNLCGPAARPTSTPKVGGA